MSEKNIFDESIILQIKAKEIGLDWLEVHGIIEKIKEKQAKYRKNRQNMKKIQ